MKNLLVVLIALVLVTCKKSSDTPSPVAVAEALPLANFTTDKTEYDAGDVMKLTSTSTNADNLRWTLPDGTTSRDATVSYSLDPTFGNVKLNVKLEAISKSGAKSDYIIKAIKVNPGKGTLTLFSSYQVGYNVSITIDGNTVASANLDYTKGTPNTCNQSGYTSYMLTAGAHVLTYTYYGSPYYFSGTKSFTISTGGCVLLNCN